MPSIHNKLECVRKWKINNETQPKKLNFLLINFNQKYFDTIKNFEKFNKSNFELFLKNLNAKKKSKFVIQYEFNFDAIIYEVLKIFFNLKNVILTEL